MNQLYPTEWGSYLGIFLVFLRALGLFLLVPGFSHNAIPNNIKILFSLSLSLVIYPTVRPYLMALDNSLSSLVGAAIRELIIGFLMGFVAYLVCEGIHLAAQFVGYQIGFGTAGLLEPQSQSSVSILVHLQTWLVLVLFFVTNLHHHVITVFVESFVSTRQLNAVFVVNVESMKLIMAVAGQVFVLAIQLASPVMLIVLLCNVAIAVLARLLPQMNILLFSFPITILSGFITLYVVAPEMMESLELVLGNVSTDMMRLLKVL